MFKRRLNENSDERGASSRCNSEAVICSVLNQNVNVNQGSQFLENQDFL